MKLSKIFLFRLYLSPLLLAAILMLVACGGGTVDPGATEESGGAETGGDDGTEVESGEEEEADTGGEEAAAEPVTVTIFVGMGTGTDPDQIQGQEDLAARFNESHEDIQIEFLIVPNEEAFERYLTMVSGDNPPDLVGPNGISTIAAFFDTWADMSEYIERDNYDMSVFYETSIALNQYPDKTLGLPMGLFPSFVFYNEDLFDAAGLDYPTHDYEDPGWTMDAMREMAMQMTLDSAGRNATDADFDREDIVQWGWSDAWTDGRGLLTKWGYENEGRPMSDDFMTAEVNNAAWVHGLQWISDGIWVDGFIPNSAAVAGLEAAGGDPFGAGTLAMFYSHTWFMSEGLNDLPFEYDLAPVPLNHQGTRIARIHADTFTVPQASQHKDQAWEVMKWLVDEEQIMDVCLIYGCLPANQNVADEFLGLLQERFPGVDYDVIFNAIDHLDDPNHESWVPEWTRVGDAINNQVNLILVGEETDAEAVLNIADEEVQAILDEYWASQ